MIHPVPAGAWLRLLAATAGIVLLAGCGGDDEPDHEPADGSGATTAPATTATPRLASPTPPAVETPVPQASPTEAATAVWDEGAVWDALDAPGDLWQQHCGSPPVAFAPDQVDVDCVVEVMQSSEAGEQAVAFFERHGFFLASFEETGLIDYGRGAVPWLNMGRPTRHVWLNGDPALIEVSVPEEEAWRAEASYAAFVAANPNAFVWYEYGAPSEVLTDLDGAAHAFDMAFPIRECRACADLGYLNLRYTFSEDGSFLERSILPFAEP